MSVSAARRNYVETRPAAPIRSMATCAASIRSGAVGANTLHVTPAWMTGPFMRAISTSAQIAATASAINVL